MTHTKTVSEVAAIGRVAVRTLHHYDELGLLSPSHRTEAGHRRYTDADLTRLHDILTWRSLGFPLEEVRGLLEDPGHDPIEAMELHRKRLVSQIGQAQERLDALDAVIGKAPGDETFSADDLVALFDGFDPADFEEETERRWGDTDAYRQSRKRTQRYGEREWRTIKAEAEAVTADFANLLTQGQAPTSAEARLVAKEHQAHICRWFYDCTPETHEGLADMYVGDARFDEHYERVAPGLASYVSEAIHSLHGVPTRRM